MTIVLPILFAAVAVGLFARRITPITWMVLGAWVVTVVLFHLLARS